MDDDQHRSDADAGSRKQHVPPPVLAAVAFGVQILLSEKRASSKGSRIAGAIIGGGAGLLMGGAVLEFRRYHTTVNPETLDTSTLVVSGPNRLTRNPMYLGLAGVLTAHAVWRRSWPALIPVALFAAVIDRTQIPAEEAVLQQRFGIEFKRYRAVTPRWFGVPRRTVTKVHR
ncbi:methyltransferase family protein [Enteractinococcus coprophilus]|uniref:Protein-S-isoprenylcysteine O-methyltransferase Ste14 n=1 Tax=Enteractinococcus coprophilus TaxID=1027633 RepID=A0A543A0K0_9MICC|nr:protein-S-isoprenylcysteine O-methyltransferase Ste14 [Enteractinococcus coprophilus]